MTQILRTLDPDSRQPTADSRQPTADSRQPLCLQLQLQQALREAIEKRILSPDDALPSERQLAADLNVSRITVRKAIDGLADEGLLQRRQGAGNFVCTRIDKNFSKLTSFRKTCVRVAATRAAGG